MISGDQGLVSDPWRSKSWSVTSGEQGLVIPGDGGLVRDPWGAGICFWPLCAMAPCPGWDRHRGWPGVAWPCPGPGRGGTDPFLSRVQWGSKW